MRVLHLTRDLPPRCLGGLSTAVGGLVRASARHGLRVSALSFDAWRPTRAGAPGPCEPGTENGVEVLRVTHLDHLGAAREFARAMRPDLLHVHHGMLWPLAASLREDLGVPAVKTVHVVQREMNALRRTSEHTRSLAGQEAALTAADCIIVPSRAAAAALARYGEAVTARVRVAPHGIDDSPAARASVAARTKPYDYAPLLAVGRFDHVKGTPVLFGVLLRALSRIRNAKAVIVGGVPANLRAELQWRRRWETQAPASMRERVRFTGWIEPEALAAEYTAAQLMVVPSRFETFGLTALEAMLFGVPVVAMPAGGLPEIVEHDVAGLVSSYPDVELLTAYTVALMRDTPRAMQLGRQGAALARKRHLWEHALPKILEVYGEVVK
ncbi:MAG TPA: glycosyltransferase family 4 protein [Candidatus Dormibacteraeota bacterium]|nr:glycosyltransferase family 4 protein [Candidatus Dormibacteraeota bacterium]